MATASVSTDSVVILEDIEWETYQTLRAVDANRNVRMTFDNGALILMSPSKLHERIAELIAQMVLVWTEESGIPRLSTGSTTIKRELLKRGFEPDKSFYIQHEAEVRGRDEFDPAVDPPPDLTIEVDVTSLSSGRMPIFAAFGIPEVWRWVHGEIVVYRLGHHDYVTAQQSSCLPAFPFDAACRIINRRLETDETTLIREFRDLARRLHDA